MQISRRLNLEGLLVKFAREKDQGTLLRFLGIFVPAWQQLDFLERGLGIAVFLVDVEVANSLVCDVWH